MSPPNPPPQGPQQQDLSQNPQAVQQFNETAEILWGSAQKEGLPPGMTRDRYLGAVAQKLKQGTRLAQIGKTVFLLTPIEPLVLELHTSTLEDGKALVQRYVVAAKTAKQHGIKKIISYADSPAFVKLAKATGLPVKITQEPHMDEITGQMKPMYKFELDL
jgi:hypothetical protein